MAPFGQKHLTSPTDLKGTIRYCRQQKHLSYELQKSHICIKTQKDDVLCLCSKFLDVFVYGKHLNVDLILDVEIDK